MQSLKLLSSSNSWSDLNNKLEELTKSGQAKFAGDVAKELDQIPELQGLSFRRDCKEENANIKLNTMYIRTLVCRQKLIDIYFARRNLNKNQKIN